MATSVLESVRNPTSVADNFDIHKIRADFPILSESIRGKSLVYLDNANTTQKPRQVIDAVSEYYEHSNANIHRATHLLSERATGIYEGARTRVRSFLNAACPEEIIFVRNATEGINLVAASYGRQFIGEGDEIVISAMEHHANIVPWQILCEEKGARLRVIPITDSGELVMEEYYRLLSDRTKFVSITQMSNALGTVNPVKEIIDAAHAVRALVLVDGAQSAYHMPVDVQALDCDFFVFSGHKLYGPTGIGVLYGKTALLESMPPYQSGGDMIRTVTFEKTTFNDLPYKFEAGTPHIAGAAGLGAAIDYLAGIGLKRIAAHESSVLTYASEALGAVDDLRIIGTAASKASVISFVFGDIHPHDIGTILDEYGVAIRTGHHCAQPIMHRYGVPATARVSLACYNTTEEIDILIHGIEHVREVFA